MRLALVALVAVAACGVTDPQPLPPGAEQIYQPSYFADLWHEAETCSGKTGDRLAVPFYRVYATGQIELDGVTGAAFYQGEHHRIILTSWLLDDTQPNQDFRRRIIRHEMLHAILRASDHPPEYFEVKCGPLV